MTKYTYTAQSSHEVGYEWWISVPKGLSLDDIDALQNAIADYTEEPSTESMLEMLEDEYYCLGLDAEKMELFKQVAVSVTCVHRTNFIGKRSLKLTN